MKTTDWTWLLDTENSITIKDEHNVIVCQIIADIHIEPDHIVNAKLLVQAPAMLSVLQRLVICK